MLKEFPRLNGLSKMTIESTLLKLMEESGELAQAISKFQGFNGEKIEYSQKEILECIVTELLDVMQVASSLAYLIEDKYQIDLSENIANHIEKLRKKGYLVEVNQEKK